MAVYFPNSPSDGDIYPDINAVNYDDLIKATNGIFYKYVRSTNSWIIVGPDNIATTEWVLDQISTDQINLDKAYDLISATNTVGILAGYNYVIKADCNTDADAGIRGNIYDEGYTVENASKENIHEWVRCILTNPTDSLGAGQFTAYGIDLEAAELLDTQVALFSRQYQYARYLLFSEYDKDNIPPNGQPLTWLDTIRIGDTLEFEYLGGNDLDYVLYRITDIEHKSETNALGQVYTGVLIKVEYLSSNVPNQDYRITGGSTYYGVKTYMKSYSTAGGPIDGQLIVRYTSTENSLFIAKEDNAEPTLRIDTVDNLLLVNDDYNDKLTDYYDGSQYVPPNPNTLVTLGHLDQRFGGNDALDPTKQGPFLSTKGGTLTGELSLTIGRKIGTTAGLGNLDIRGRTTNGSSNTNNSLLQTKHDGNNADYISYNSNNTNNGTTILNKSQIEGMIKVTDDKLGNYVERNGSTQMTGHLKLKLKPNSNDPADPTEKYHAASKEYVDTRPMGPVSPTSTTVEGQFYWQSGALYINPYTT